MAAFLSNNLPVATGDRTIAGAETTGLPVRRGAEASVYAADTETRRTSHTKGNPIVQGAAR